LSDGKELKNIFKLTVTAMDTTRDNKVIEELWTYVAP
jgi:ribosomal protein S16